MKYIYIYTIHYCVQYGQDIIRIIGVAHSSRFDQLATERIFCTLLLLLFNTFKSFAINNDRRLRERGGDQRACDGVFIHLYNNIIIGTAGKQ